MWPFNRKENRGSSLEDPSVPISAANIIAHMGWESISASGAVVNRETALKVPAVWAAVNFIANTMASLPLSVYRDEDTGREKREDDPLYRILHDNPNPEWTSYNWRKYTFVQTLTSGRSYSYIERANNGKISAIWPLDPVRTTPKRDGFRTVYKYQQPDGTRVTYSAEEILDLPFMMDADQVSHISPTARLADAIGLGIVLQKYASRFFQNGGVPPLVFEGPFQTPGAIARASEDMANAIKDTAEKKRPVLPIPDGHKLHSIGANPGESQLIEARRFVIEDVARAYSLSPIFLQDLTHGTFANTEQQDLHVVKHTLSHWVTQFEQEMNLKLIRESGSKRYVEFDMDGLLRGDFKTRMEGYAKGIQNAIYTPNEARKRENLPDQPGGDNIHLQQNMASLQAVQNGEPDGEPNGD